MNSYIRILRPSVCFITVLGIIVGSIIAGVSDPFLVAIACIAGFLITGAGNVINDYFDSDIDRINAPHRPIPSGKISKNTAMRYGIAIDVIGLAAAWFINIYFFFIAVANSIVLAVYAWKLKRTPLIGNIATSYLAVSSFIAAGLIREFPLGLNSALIVVIVISFLGTVSREIFKDIEDIEGDRKMKARTLPIVWGAGRSSVLGYILMYSACGMFFYPVIAGMFGAYYLAFVVPALLLCIYTIKLPPSRTQKILKIVMYIVLAGFVAGSVVR